MARLSNSTSSELSSATRIVATSIIKSLSASTQSAPVARHQPRRIFGTQVTLLDWREARYRVRARYRISDPLHRDQGQEELSSSKVHLSVYSSIAKTCRLAACCGSVPSCCSPTCCSRRWRG